MSRLRRPTGGLWSHPDFLKLWTGQTISEVGSQVSQLAIPWLAAVNLHASPIEFSLLGVLGFLPFILFALPAIRSYKINFWRLMDGAAPGMVLGVIIGRVGDLIVGDHLGKTTTFVLGFKCPTDITKTASPCLPGPGAVVHQTAFYDLVMSCVLLAVLLWLRRHRPHYDGFLIMLFAAWYGCQRIIEDFLREDVRHFGLTGSQWSSIVLVALCLWLLVFYRRTPPVGQWDRVRTDDGPSEPVESEPPSPASLTVEPPTLSPPEPHQEE